ncbi:MAG: tRNA pseudouridine(38-40) synthase TruA [Pseudomonadota bacterium]|nr:tRNA pseudouridine(38-40) synthase TruA [Alphaproteobacteria bacterium]
MKRYKFILEYDGAYFFGWQRQLIEPTVQQVLENQLSFLVKHDVIVHGAGRTDTGVHATGQVAHADLEYPYSPYRLQKSLNHFLAPKGLCIRNCEEVDSSFHARFLAKKRTYQYFILNRTAPSTCNKKIWHVPKELNISHMRKAAKCLIGTHDFSSFRDSQCQSKSPVKTLSHFHIERKGEIIIATIEAPSFLHHQVRIMIGTLKNVGTGSISIKDFIQIQEAKDRKKAGQTAPASGLFLTNVEY